MRRKYKRLKLIELCDVQALEDVIELFGKDYNKEIQYLTDYTSLLLRDKVLMNKWRKRDGDFRIIEFTKNDEVFRYLKATAFIEIQAPEKDAIIDGNVLPRANRVKSYEYPVVFFENGGKVYCVLVCAEYMDSNIKSHLMGAGRCKKELAEAWGKTNDVDIENYILSSNLFYWLTKMDGQELKFKNETLTINSIKALANSSLRGDTNYSSEGEDLLSEVVIKTTLGVESNVDSVGMTIVQEDGTFDIMLDRNGTCGIDDQSSVLIREGGQIELIDDYIDEVIIRIYCCVIPMLKKMYKDQVEIGQWTEDSLQVYKKHLVLEVINDLCYDNEISKEEILGLDSFKNI